MPTGTHEGERHRVGPRDLTEHVDLVEANGDRDLVGGDDVQRGPQADVSGDAIRDLGLVVHGAEDLGRQRLPDRDCTPEGRAHTCWSQAGTTVGLRSDALLARRKCEWIALSEQA